MVLASVGLALACRGPLLAEPGQAFDDDRTSLKGGTVSRRDAANYARYARAAREGDREAQTLVGLMLQTGQGVPRNDFESAYWFRLAAEADECAAQYHLGLLYLQGRGVPVDLDRATQWLRRSAEHRIEIQQSSFLNLYVGLFGLGAVEARPPTLAEAGSPLQQATAARDAAAAASLHARGQQYLAGDGVPVDPAHAVRFFRMAAGAGNADAQRQLGLAYRDGHGARRDPVRGHMWLNIAAAGGSREARDELAALEASLSPDEIARAEFLAVEWDARRRP